MKLFTFNVIQLHFWHIQAFLDFRGFDFCDFPFNAVYNSILFSSPLVLLSDLDLCGLWFCGFIFVSPHEQRKLSNACIAYSKIKVRIELGVVMMNFHILCLLTVSTKTCIYTAVISCLVEQSDIIIHFIFKWWIA